MIICNSIRCATYGMYALMVCMLSDAGLLCYILIGVAKLPLNMLQFANILHMRRSFVYAMGPGGVVA